jgi:MoaA/NifB/PqqE/SkfB family radical SAM enzyme
MDVADGSSARVGPAAHIGRLGADYSHLKVFVTYRCNLHCSHCVQSRVAGQTDPTHTPPPLEELEAFIASVARLNPAVRIYLSGGEPLLSPRFFQTAHIIRRQGLAYKTMTNGLLLEERYRHLLEAPPDGIWVTFNGTGHRHDHIVGLEGGYDRLCQSVRHSIPHLKRAHIQVGAVLVINALTYNRLSQDIESIGSLGFDEVVVQHLSFLPDAVVEEHQAVYRETFGGESLFCFGEGADGSGIEPFALYGELLTLRQREYPFRVVIFPPVYEWEELADYYSDAPQRWRQRRCARALREMWVHPDGSVTVCFAHRVGHISQPFEAILASPELARWRQSFAVSAPLPGCMRCHRLYMQRAEGKVTR